MSRRVRIVCDSGELCASLEPAFLEWPDDGQALTIVQVTAQAGWTLSLDGDLCPECSRR